MRAVQFGTVYSFITFAHSSPLMFRPSSTKCKRGRNVASTLDARDHHPSRGRCLRRRQSQLCLSAPSASIFEVLRDSQILGSETLKLSGTGEKSTLTPTDPCVLMVGLLAQREEGLVEPGDVAEQQFRSSWRLLAHSSSQEGNQPRKQETARIRTETLQKGENTQSPKSKRVLHVLRDAPHSLFVSPSRSSIDVHHSRRRRLFSTVKYRFFM